MREKPSEYDLLKEMLEILGPHDCYKLGVLMGIMRKADDVYIGSLETELAAARRTISDLEKALEAHEQDTHR